MRYYKPIVAGILILAAWSPTLTCQVPTTVPLQGQLFQSNGQPMVDGTHEAVVRLFDAATGGTGFDVCAPCTFTSVDGVFQIVLGGEGQPPLPRFTKSYWVELTVDGELLDPRIQIHSVPAAHEAAHVVQQREGLLPVGSVIPGANVLSSATGFMIADGSPLSSTEYPELFAAIGTLWGDGTDDDDDATDFNLPDLRGVSLVGDDMGSDRDPYVESRQFNGTPVSDSNTVGSSLGVVDAPVYRPPSITPRPALPGTQSGRIQPIEEEEEAMQARRAPNVAVVWYIRAR